MSVIRFDPEAADWLEVVRLLEMCEGEFGGMTMKPSELLEETNFFFVIKDIVTSAKGEIQKWKKDHKPK